MGRPLHLKKWSGGFFSCYQVGKSNGKKLSPTSIPTASLSVIYNMLVSSDCVHLTRPFSTRCLIIFPRLYVNTMTSCCSWFLCLVRDTSFLDWYMQFLLVLLFGWFDEFWWEIPTKREGWAGDIDQGVALCSK